MQEQRALERVSGQLLDGCRVTQARWLAALFSHSSQDLDIVMVRLDSLRAWFVRYVRKRKGAVKMLMTILEMRITCKQKCDRNAWELWIAECVVPFPKLN